MITELRKAARSFLVGRLSSHRDSLVLLRDHAAYSVCSPPPCGEGLGVGVHQRITARPPPRRSAAKLAQAAQAWLRGPTLPARGEGRTEFAAR
ncbi:MAG: hypothetical protein E6G76_09605 [Alphaproteobacteria bacterium]|nr:MAG: hypothetical protein E6G76_09605 [Alphaproteobacteria bacterium]